MGKLYQKELTLELMNKVLDDMKKSNKNPFVLTIVGDVDKVIKEVESFHSLIRNNLNNMNYVDSKVY